jgi:hypothetical protein
LIYAEISLSILNWLSGSADKQSIEVTNCFCVPHKEYEERVEADLQYAQDMFELNKKVATQVKMFLLLHRKCLPFLSLQYIYFSISTSFI